MAQIFILMPSHLCIRNFTKHNTVNRPPLSGQYAFAPVAAGFFLGALFVYGADVLMTYAGVHSPYDLG